MAGLEAAPVQQNILGMQARSTTFRKAESEITKRILFLFGMAVLAVLEATEVIPIQKGEFVHAAFLLGAVICFFGGIWWMWCFFLPEVVLAIGPRGIRDVRFSPDLIGWDAIETITDIKLHFGGFLLLKLLPGSEKAFRLTRWRRLTNFSRGVIGWKDIFISTGGTDGTYENLVRPFTSLVQTVASTTRQQIARGQRTITSKFDQCSSSA